MSCIWKFPLKPVTKLSLPKDAEILKVAGQGDEIFLWARLDSTKSKQVRTFRAFATGQQIDDDLNLKFIDTAFVGVDDTLVFHVFEDLS